MIKIIDDFIEQKDLINIESAMLNSDNFNWFYTKTNSMYPEPNYNSMFYHNFLSRNGQKSIFFDIINPLINKFNEHLTYSKIYSIKSNLTLNQNVSVKHGKHIDCRELKCDTLTAIFYLYTTNGFTTIDDINVNDKSNRCVIFDGNKYHFANLQTDKRERLIINFNFII